MIANLHQQMMPLEEETSVGGTYTNPTPPVEPPSEINLTINLDKSKYIINENMTVSGTVSRTACSNSVVNMKIEGKIVGETNYSIIYNNTNLAGGTNAPFSNSSFQASADRGSKTFRVRATTYSSEFYYTELTDITSYFSSYTLAGLIEVVESNENYTYNYGANKFVNNTTNQEFPVGYVAGGTEALNSAEMDIPFTVINPIVDVTVDAVDGPINKNTGDSVAVSWTSVDTDGMVCECRCTDGTNNIDCGSNPLNPNDRSYCGSGLNKEPTTFYEILRPTIFKVSCDYPNSGGNEEGGTTPTSEYVYYQLSPCNAGNPSAEHRALAGSWQTENLVQGASSVYYTIAGSNTNDDPSKTNLSGITLETDRNLCR